MNNLIILMAGIINAIPIDQPNIEIIRKSVLRDIKGAFSVSIGSSLGDSAYFALVFSSLAPLFKEQIFQQIISLVGGLVLVSYGISRFIPVSRLFRWRKLFIVSSSPFLSGIIFSIFNPSAGLSSIAVINFIKTESVEFSIIYAGLFLLGGMIWSSILIFASWMIAWRFGKKIETAVDKFSGALLIFVGLFMIYTYILH